MRHPSSPLYLHGMVLNFTDNFILFETLAVKVTYCEPSVRFQVLCVTKRAVFIVILYHLFSMCV